MKNEEKVVVSGLLGDPRPITKIVGLTDLVLAYARDQSKEPTDPPDPSEFDIIKPYPEPAGNGPLIWFMCIRGNKVVDRISSLAVARLTHDTSEEAEDAARKNVFRNAKVRFAEKDKGGKYCVSVAELRDIAESPAQIQELRDAAFAELKARGAWTGGME